MSTLTLLLTGFAAGATLGAICNRAAYCNGATDGFGFAWEPTNPGYQKAGRYLCRHMAYRWRQLGNPSYHQCVTSDFENARNP